MTGPVIEDLIRRLEAGEDPESLWRSRIPRQQRELLRRCAVPRMFSADAFETILRTSTETDEPYTVERLVNEGYAETVPGVEPRYRLRGAVRTEWLRDWWPPDADVDRVPEPLAEFSRQLADASTRAGDHLEGLYHLALADPAAAREQFLEFYREADARFDLTACQDVLDTLGGPDRLAFIDPSLTELRADWNAYLRSRAYWSAEWYQSARLQRRESLHTRLAGLLDGSGPRVLEAFAGGGMGKTIQLRWFITRWCVPEPRRVPCARIDFDVVDPVAASQDPWLLLLVLAAQLDRQVAGSPFQLLLSDYGDLLTLLERQPSQVTHVAASRLASDRNGVSRQVVSRFLATLAETTADRAVVIVVDTTEEVLLHPAGDMAAILDLLRQVHDRVERARIVLAGRYQLRGRAELSDLLPPMESVRLAEFSRQECRDYLSQIRGISGPTINVIIRKSGRSPFRLALLADLVVERPDLKAADILRYDDPGILYVVERIVARIDDPIVRWVFRYGVVPRHLTRDFVADVMRPYLASAMSGTSAMDDPDRDPRPRRAKASPFPTDVLADEQTSFDVDDVWQKLLRYASNYSWVSRYAEQPDAVVFHPEALAPMRAMLRRHKVYRALHQAAARYFARRAAAEPDNWLAWTHELIYHRFQTGGAAAAKEWRAALLEAGRRGGADWRRDLAGEVLRKEYVDARLQARPFHQGRPIVDSDLVAEAHFEVARATVEIIEANGLGPADPLWTRALTALRRVALVRAHGGWPAAPLSDLAQAEASLRRLEGKPAEAQQVLLSALGAQLTDADRATLTELLGDSVGQQDSDRSAALFRTALECYRAAGDSRSVQRTSRKLLGLVTAADRLDEALTILDELDDTPPSDTDADALALVEAARLRLRAGQPAALLERLDARMDTQMRSSLSAAYLWARAAAHLALLDPARARFLCQDGLRRLREPTTPDARRIGIELRELHARISAALLDMQQAAADLQAAVTGWDEIGDIERVGLAASMPAEFDRRVTDPVAPHLNRLAETAERYEVPPQSEAWLRLRLYRAQIAAEAAHPQEADKAIRDAVGLAQGSGSGRLAALAAVAGLRLGSSQRISGHLARLVDALEKVYPVTARAALLAGLRACPALSTPQRFEPTLRRLLSCVIADQDSPEPAGSEPARAEAAARRVIIADLQRFAGLPELAGQSLQFAARAWGHGGSAIDFRSWVWLDCASRIAPAAAAEPPNNLDQVAQRLTEFPALGGAFRVLQAAWCLRFGVRVEVARLDEAERLLARGSATGSEWEVRLEVVRALTARAAGDHRREAAHLAQAGELWQTLGRRGRLPYVDDDRTFAADVIDAGVDPETAAWRRPGVVALVLGVDPEDQIVATRAWPRRDLVASPPDTDPGQVLVPVLGSELGRGPEAGAVDLLLQIDSHRLGTLAWEAAQLPTTGRPLSRHPLIRRIIRIAPGQRSTRHLVTAVQLALRQLGRREVAVDGVFGPKTYDRLRSALNLAGVDLVDADPTADALRSLLLRLQDHPYPTVVLIQPGDGPNSSLRPESDARIGTLLRWYETAGLRPQMLTGVDPDDLAHAVGEIGSRGPLAAIHVTGTFGGSGPEVFIGSRELSKIAPDRRVNRLYTATLERVVSRLPLGDIAPAIILDPDPLPGLSENRRQLALRNQFAHELFAGGTVPTILAIGLDREEHGAARQAIARTLVAGGSGTEAITAMRKATVAASESDIGAAAAAVWTRLLPQAMTRFWTR